MIGGLGLSWQAALGVLCLIYFYSHYLFASSAAHIGAMYTAMLSVAVGCGAPPMVSALALGYLSSLMGCLTNYGIGSAPSYYGSNYVSQVTPLASLCTRQTTSQVPLLVPTAVGVDCSSGACFGRSTSCPTKDVCEESTRDFVEPLHHRRAAPQA